MPVGERLTEQRLQWSEHLLDVLDTDENASMKFRVQQLDLPHGRIRLFQRTWYLFCTQDSPNEAWSCRRVHDLQLGDALCSLGFEDYRDTSVIFQQTRAAVREFGLGQGFIEYDFEREHDQGPVRHRGDLRDRPEGGAT